jgi:hypothetical protein
MLTLFQVSDQHTSLLPAEMLSLPAVLNKGISDVHTAFSDELSSKYKI